MTIYTRCLETESIYEDGCDQDKRQETFILYVGEPRELPRNPEPEVVEEEEIPEPLKIETTKEGSKVGNSRISRN